MLESAWGSGKGSEQHEEITSSAVRMMDEQTQMKTFFDVLRAGNIEGIRNVLVVNRDFLNGKLFGYEGHDVFDVIKSKSKRCYHFTGAEKDGYFFPLHVVAEAGHKTLILLLIKAGADVTLADYRGDIAEQKCNFEAINAFYELRGLKFEAFETYHGGKDKQGRRTGQGILCFKPEGYLSEEKILYRGGFKHGMYDGHGTLYWVGTEVIRYVGRFKFGKIHGRGVEFNRQGTMIYKGTFRDDNRDGRGEEFAEGVRVYKGEFANNNRHGFGIAYLAEGHRYIGRFENNAMGGLGIYCQPNGDRYEGMFYNNKPDGPGSLYKVTGESGPDGPKYEATHAIWQKGRPISSVAVPFKPGLADMPSKKESILETLELAVAKSDIIGDEAEGGVGSAVVFEGGGRRRRDAKPLTGTKSDEQWKIQLTTFVKLSSKESALMGLPSLKSESDDEEEAEEKTREEENEEDDEGFEDEVLGYHFMNCAELYIAYIYVISASKVFEGRLDTKDMSSSAPDFEAVFTLVLDAVDKYNEQWETASKDQQVAMLVAEAAKAVEDVTTKDKPKLHNHASVHSLPKHNVENKRPMFMSEREKKEEQYQRQRMELEARKGSTELDPMVEQSIGAEVMETLERNLIRLVDEHVGKVRNAHPGQRASISFTKATALSDKAEDYQAGKGAGGIPSISEVQNLRDRGKNGIDYYANQQQQSQNEFATELLYLIRTSQSILGPQAVPAKYWPSKLS